MKSTSKKFFKSNGKTLRTSLHNNYYLERVNSIYGFSDETNKILKGFSIFYKVKNFNKKNVLTLTSLTLFLIGIISMVSSLTFINKKETNKYNIFSSMPLTLDEASYSISSDDSRAKRIDGIFRKFKCPLEGMGQTFVDEADENAIPWWLVASVAFQESSCGKNTPKVDGNETYNAWGWGVYGGMAKSFDNWASGIETVSEYFNTRFFSQGVTNTCEIMKVYTPPSDGSWCRGVNEFSSLIQNYQTI